MTPYVAKKCFCVTFPTSCLLQPSFPPGQPTSVVFATPPPPQMNPPPQPRQVGPPIAQRTRVKSARFIPFTSCNASIFNCAQSSDIYCSNKTSKTDLERRMSRLFCPSDTVAVFMFVPTTSFASWKLQGTKKISKLPCDSTC